MRRSEPLARLTPLSRSGALRRVGLLAATKRRRNDDRPLKAKARDRDLWECFGCGDSIAQVASRGLRLEIHHRLPLGRGGRDELANLICLCGLGNAAGCHRRVDQERLTWAVPRGLVLLTGSDPTTMPVQDAHGVWWRLGNDGSKRKLDEAAA